MSKTLLPAILMVISLMLASCSQSQKSETTTSMVISFGALTGATFSGGALIQVINGLTGESSIIELTYPYNVTLPFGVWSLHFVGFEGSSTWQGPHACGGVSNYKFSETDQTVQIRVVATECVNEPYVSIINSRFAKWDVALWDSSSALWGL